MAPTATTSIAAIRLARHIVATGTPLDEHRIRARHGCRRLGAAFGVSSGTIYHHLRALERLGVRVESQPMTVIDIARLEELDPGGTNTEPTPAPESSSDRGGEWAPRSVTPDNLRAVEAIETLGVVIAETPGISETQIAALTHAIDVLGELAGVATIATETQPIATPTSRHRDTNRDVAVSSSLEVKGREPPPTSMSRPKTSRSSRPCDAVNALVAPLIEKGRREGKPTAITNPQGLVDALASYDDAQITEAVAAFVAEPWTKIDAPLAVFVRRAQIGHDIFITPAPKVEPAGVGERPTLVTDAVHLLDVPEVMPTEVATANLKALAAIRSRNTKTQL